MTSGLLLIDPNSFNGDIYYLDNFDIYGPESGGDATSINVASVSTGTQGAGRGQKYGTASVVVRDDLGNPAAGVSVSGAFSGTFNENVSGVTGADGVAQMRTSASAGGGVVVNFCVSSIAGALPHNTAASTGLCQ